MAKITVTIKVGTKARAGLLMDADPVPLKKGVGKASVEAGAENNLVYGFHGDPGEPYEVTLSAPKGKKIEMVRGENPLSSSISTSRYNAAGYMRFIVS